MHSRFGAIFVFVFAATALSGCLQMLSGNHEITDATVKANMKEVARAADLYSIDHGGDIPSLSQLKAWMPKQPPADPIIVFEGEGLRNPFAFKYDTPKAGITTIPLQWPVEGSITNVAEARKSPPKQMTPGTLEYTLFPDKRTYAIIGGGHDGKALAEKSGDTLVISNQ